MRQRRRSQKRGVGNRIALTGKKGRVPSENPDVLFRGDFESGFDGWHVQSLSYRASLFSSGAFQGSGAAHFEVQDGDVEPETGSPRSEVSGPTFNEGEDLYFRDAIRIPAASSYNGPWQIVQQLHEEDWGGSPGIAVFLESDDSLKLGRGDGDATYWESEPLARNRWHDLVYRVNLSRDSSAGFVEVWLNGVPQALENGGTRAYGETIQTAQTYLKAGIYRSRSSSGTSLVEHDNIVVGTSLAAVTAG
jgi:Polysaccharide lyase